MWTGCSRVSRSSWERCVLMPNAVTSLLSQFLDMGGEKFVQADKAGIALEVGAHVVQRERDVQDVDRVAARDRLETKSAQRFEIALDRHQIEPPAKFVVVFGARLLPWPAPEGQEERDQVVDFGLREIDIRIAQQRHQVIRIGTHSSVLE